MTDTYIKRTYCAGIVGRCKGHYHYLFDMDDVTLESALYSADFIAKQFNCDVAIRHSGGGYHLICPNPMEKETVRKMQRWTPCEKQDYFILDDIAGLTVTHHHWNVPTGSVLRTSMKGRKDAPQTVGAILDWGTRRTWCRFYVKVLGISPDSSRLRDSQPVLVFYQTQSKVL